jgi:hypothetical protein
LTYYVLAVLSIVLFLALGADLLVQIAAPSYRAAANLLPVIATGFGFYGLFVVLNRIASIPRKHMWYAVLSLVCAVTLVVSMWLLAPAFGAWGAAVSTCICTAFGSACVVVLMYRSDAPVPIAWGKLLGACLTAAGCYLLAIELRSVAGDLAPLLDVVALFAYPVLLVAFGIVPRSRVRRLTRMMVNAVYPYGETPLRPLARLPQVDEGARATFVAVFRDRRPVGDVAASQGISVPVVQARIVRALRVLGDLGRPSPTDAELGAFILTPFTTVLARDTAASGLWERGVEPLMMDRLVQLADRCRRQSLRAWRRAEQEVTQRSDAAAALGSFPPDSPALLVWASDDLGLTTP